MNKLNSWSTNKKLTLVAVWILATVGRVAYVSLDVPGETMTNIIIAAAVIAGLGLFLRTYAFKPQQVLAS